VIGLVQVGDQAMADRYTYIPGIGLMIMAAWGAAEPARRSAQATRAAITAGLAVVALLSLATFRELSYWRGTIPLMERALEVTRDNYVAENNLGSALFDAGRSAEAIPHFLEAIKLRPGHANAHYNVGVALLGLSRWAEAADHFRIAMHVTPDDTDTMLNLGAAYLNLGRNAEAAGLFERTLALKPGYRMAEENLATARRRLGSGTIPAKAQPMHAGGDTDAAGSQVRTGMALLEQGEAARAIPHFEAALELAPGQPDALRGLAAARDIVALMNRRKPR
jgi:tetratricopeptide (TPR) repeat protein